MKRMAEMFRSKETQGGSASTQPTADVSLAEATKATQNYATYYHHASPFDAEGLLGIWSRCRDQAPTAAVCRQRLGLPAKGKISPEERANVRACREKLEVGPGCEAGLEAARGLVESGILPPARESS